MALAAATRKCPDCRNLVWDDRGHVCKFPILADAAGVELTEPEARLLRWLAGMLDREQTEAAAGLFRRMRKT